MTAQKNEEVPTKLPESKLLRVYFNKVDAKRTVLRFLKVSKALLVSLVEYF